MRTKIVPLMGFVLGALLAFAGAAAAEDPNPAVPRWTDADYEITVADGLDEVNLEGQVDLHEVPTDNPQLESHCGSSCSADELREAHQQFGDAGQEKMENALEAAVEENIEAALTNMGAEEIQTTADVDEASLAETPEGDKYHPPIPIDATGSGQLSFAEEAGVEADQIDAVFRMGAKATQDVNVSVDRGTNLTLSLAVPSPLNVLATEDGVIAANGSVVTWTEENWKAETASAIEDTARLGDPTVEVPTDSDGQVDVTIDISEVDVAYGSLVGDGAPALANLNVSVDASFRSIENPRDFEQIELSYLSADALRIAIANDLVDENELVSVEDRAREQIKQSFQQMTGEEVRVQGTGFDPADLSEDQVGDPPGTGEAIEFSLAADETVPFPPDQSQTSGAQGFTVTTLSIGELPLPSVDVPYDVDRSVTIVLPPGLDLTFDEPAGYTVSQEDRDGRTAYTFSSNGDGSDEGAAIQNSEVVVEHPFVWNVFWPLIVTLILLLVVLPAVVIGLTIRRRRKRGPPSSSEATQPVAGSQSTQRAEASEDT